MNAIELIAALKGADEETAMELVERLQCGEIDCSVLPTGKDNAVQQAQTWAQEARTQKGIVDEIGKLVGCPNDWEMVGAVKAALSANGGEVMAFGNGDYTVEVGGYAGEHAVFVAPAIPPGRVGDLSEPTTGEDRWRLVPGERVMTFPTEVQAFAVAEAIAGRRVNRLDGSHPAPPSVAVPEGWKLVPIEPTTEMRAAFHDANEEWEDGGLYSPDHQYQAMLTAVPSPDHIADAGKVVPIGYLTNQAVARLQSDERLNGEHLYAFKPDDLSKFQAVYLAPTVKESLTIEDFNGMCRIVEAVSQMTDGFAIDQCHMDRAREIVQDATRLRTAGDEGEGV